MKKDFSDTSLHLSLALFDKAVVTDAVKRLPQFGLFSPKDSRLVAMLATIQEFSTDPRKDSVLEEVMPPTSKVRPKTKIGKFERDKLYPIPEALAMIEEAEAALHASINLVLQPKISAKKFDLGLLGTAVVRAGFNKSRRVAVFAQGVKADEARAAGADLVGMDDLAELIKMGDMPFDVLIATPAGMRLVGPLSQLLGPRGLMPSVKSGTVTPDVLNAVKRAKAGQSRLRISIVDRTLSRRRARGFTCVN